MAHDRIYNFNAGPSTLPEPVLEEVREELLNYQGTGMSAMELSHRSAEYDAIHQEARTLVTELIGLGDEWDVLFLQGGASGQFAQIPLNLLKTGQSADYVITGRWSKKAIKEAGIVASARVCASSEEDSFQSIPDSEGWDRDPSAVYTHITSNNTIAGTQYHAFPTGGPNPLVADMSSDIMSRPLDPSPFGLFYAGAQKNLGPAGVTLVCIRKELIEDREDLPVILRYKTHADKGSLYNTPPSLAIYIVGKVLRWVKQNGGLAAMGERNEAKAKLLYGAIDESDDFYRCPVATDDRSWMNVVFRLPEEGLEKTFIEQAKNEGMGGLKGHRSVGGVRVSMYNAMSREGVQSVVEFMREFQRTHG